MSTSQSAESQAASWKIPLRARPAIRHNPLRLFINLLEWVAGNDAANRGLGTLTSLISVCAVVIAVYQYFATSTERNLQTETQIWQGVFDNTGQGQKAAVQLLAAEGFPMIGIHLRNADLSTISIAGANLSGADIEVTNLSNVDLTGVEFNGATLGNDDLSYANLTGADLNNLSPNAAPHSDNFSGAIMPAGANLSALAALACIGRTKTGAVIWPVQNGRLLSWPLDSHDQPLMCPPANTGQASCVSPWCNPARVKKPWYDLGFLLAPLTSAVATANAATPVPADSNPAVKTHPASAPTQKPPPPTTTRQSSQAMSPPI
jgi:hypothetical protein